MNLHTAVIGLQGVAQAGAAAGPPGDTSLLGLFDSLLPGQSFVLSGARSLGRQLSVLQAEKKGLFEWALLEAGPEIWRAEVVRRAATPGCRRQVGQALAWDHDRLDGLETEAFEARDAGRPGAAKAAYDLFAFGLARHIEFEETLLFPVFEERSGCNPGFGPTTVMRQEHAEIRTLLGQIAAGIADPGASLSEPRRALRAVLEQHNVKEEEILYPALDALLTADEGGRLVARIQAFGT